jgi:hypothetical protein
MLNAIFLVFQLRSSYGMHNLSVASMSMLYHLENAMLLKVVLSESTLECQGSNIFARCPLSASTNGLLADGIHLSIVNAGNRYPYVKVPPFSWDSLQAMSSSSIR